MRGYSKRILLDSCMMGLSLFFLSAVYFVSPILGVEQTPVGTRPMGMGETFVAVADDANAVHLNPAGIALIRRYILNGMHAGLFGTSPVDFSGLDQNYVSVVLPVTKNFAMGVDWMNIGIDDDELGFKQNKFNLALSLNIRDVIAVGMNGKFVSVDTGLDGMDIDTASGLGLDAGILFFPRFLPKVRDKLQIGLMLQDFAGNHTKGIFGGTSIRHDFAGLEIANDKEIQHHEKVLPIHYKVGVAYNIIQNPQRTLLVSVDFDDRFHFGSEFWAHPMTAIRVGAQMDKEGITYSLGGTLKYINNKLFENSWLELNYAWVVPPTLPATSYFSLSTSFDFHRSPIKVEKVLISEGGIYATHHKYYAKEIKPPNNHDSDIAVETYQLDDEDTAGRIWVRNKSKKDMDVKIAIAIEEYIYSTDITKFFTIYGKQTIPVPLSLPFRENVIMNSATRDEDVTARIKVIAVEKDGDKKYETSQDKVFMLHDKNKIVWDDIRRLGSFITVATVEPFARKMVENHKRLLSEYEKQLPQNILQAMLLFEALVEKQIIYIKDANSPSYGSYLPDTVRYPQQLLSGEVSSADCDDFTALYCAVLESVGISTALIGLKDHILMAFDTEISWEIAQDITIPINGTAWIPIETTMLGQLKQEEAEGGTPLNRFVQAWQDALKTIPEAEIECETVADAWEIYKPAYTSLDEDGIPSDVPKISKENFDHNINHEWLLEILAGVVKLKKEKDDSYGF